MKTEITDEGNKLIRDFMGHGYSATRFPYGRLWDCLMPVIDKIEKLGYKVYIDVDCIIDNHGKPPIIIDGEKLEKINTVWLAVVQFIEWYNQQNKIK